MNSLKALKFARTTSCHTGKLVGFALAAVLAAVAVQPHPAFAQGAPTPVFPALLDVHQVKLGAWAEYSMDVANNKMKQKLAVVARDESSTTVEMAVEGGPMTKMGPMLLQLQLPRDPKKGGRPVSVVMQLGKNAPMQMPPDHPMAPKEPFKLLDPKVFQGKKLETIKVPAGTFSAYRHVQAQGDQEAVTWLSEKAPPLGLVKMESKTPMGAAKVELTKQGQGAKSSVAGKPVPFDQNLFMQQIMAGMSGSAGASKK